jgi:hypothetical protein
MTAITAACSSNAPQATACPEWCDRVHNADGDGNYFHRGRLAVVSAPEKSAMPLETDKDSRPPMLTAHLVLPAGPEGDDEPPQITVDTGDLWGPYAELDVDQADEFIRDLKEFTAFVELYRDRLAAIKEQQS